MPNLSAPGQSVHCGHFTSYHSFVIFYIQHLRNIFTYLLIFYLLAYSMCYQWQVINVRFQAIAIHSNQLGVQWLLGGLAECYDVKCFIWNNYAQVNWLNCQCHSL